MDAARAAFTAAGARLNPLRSLEDVAARCTLHGMHLVSTLRSQHSIWMVPSESTAIIARARV